MLAGLRAAIVLDLGPASNSIYVYLEIEGTTLRMNDTHGVPRVHHEHAASSSSATLKFGESWRFER